MACPKGVLLDRRFLPGIGQGQDELFDDRRVDAAGRSAADVESVRGRKRFGGDLFEKGGQVLIFEAARLDSGREVTVRAFLRAERPGDVDTRHACIIAWAHLFAGFGIQGEYDYDSQV